MPAGGVGRRSTREGFFVHSSGREDGRWVGYSFFVPRRWKMGCSSFFGGRSPTPPRPLLPSDLRPILRGRRSKMEGSSIFGSENRRLKMGGSSIFGSEERRKKGGSSKNPPLLRRTPPSSKNPLPLLSSFFGSEDRRTPAIFDLQSRRLGRKSPWAPWWAWLGLA